MLGAHGLLGKGGKSSYELLITAVVMVGNCCFREEEEEKEGERSNALLGTRTWYFDKQKKFRVFIRTLVIRIKHFVSPRRYVRLYVKRGSSSWLTIALF